MAERSHGRQRAEGRDLLMDNLPDDYGRVILINHSSEHYICPKAYFSFIPTEKEAEDILLGGLRGRKEEDGSRDCDQGS